MVPRQLQKHLKRLARLYPVVTLTGPRQSGKTTLCQQCFLNRPYFNLEDLSQREHAQTDPQGFLRQAPRMVIDEIQRVPALLSYIQVIVDKDQRPGQFILTGSHQFELMHRVSQSLAGRNALLRLLPFSIQELKGYKKFNHKKFEPMIYNGFYPRVVVESLKPRPLSTPTEAMSFYMRTYLEKDLRPIKEIKFELFLKLCASHIGCVLNQSRMACDIGVDAKTVAAWLSILEASYVVYLLPAHTNNFRKRLVKSPKIYFYDVGLAAYLLGIKNHEHVLAHPLKGMLFENLVVIEKLKQCWHNAQDARLYFFRDNTGMEIDLLEEDGPQLDTYEVKAGYTVHASHYKHLTTYKKLNPNNKKSHLVYAGDKSYQQYGHQCLPFFDV